MRKIIIILGPTAVGKTALSVRLSKEFQGQIISADSIQVYKGLDIVSGKDKDLYGSIPVSLLDIVTPLTPFNISDYFRFFHDAFSAIPSNMLPIITGGSAYYINALLHPIDSANIKPDEKLRFELEKFSVKELQDRLRKLNPDKFNSINTSDRNNPRRLIRAIEVYSSNVVVSSTDHKSVLDGFDVKIIGLQASQEIIYKRIDQRVEERLRQGALGEATALFENYDNLAPQVKTASGYKQLFEHLMGIYSLEVAVEKWKTAEHQNVKKQMTWFKKFKNVNWLDIADEKYAEKAENLISNWLNSSK